MCRNKIVVNLLHEKMGITPDADFREFDQFGIAAVSIDCIYKLTGHLQTDFPVAPAQCRGIGFWNIVAKIYDNRLFCEFRELVRSYRHSGKSSR